MTPFFERLAGRRTATARFDGAQGRSERPITIVRGFAAARGFMGAAPSATVLLFPGERAIHMAFMRGALQVWFLAQIGPWEYQVLDRHRVAPWSLAVCRRADAILEAWPGVLADFDRCQITTS